MRPRTTTISQDLVKVDSAAEPGGTFYKIDCSNFPASKTMAATFVTLQPKGLRERHWHPTVLEMATQGLSILVLEIPPCSQTTPGEYQTLMMEALY
jgi:oxalate decarboxylase/phosphoglucose isomerase-like protein (cupin superfamily)